MCLLTYHVTGIFTCPFPTMLSATLHHVSTMIDLLFNPGSFTAFTIWLVSEA